VRVHRSRNDRLRMRLRLRGRDRGVAVTRRHVADQVVNKTGIDRCAESGGRAPAYAGRESGDSNRVVSRIEFQRRVGAVDDVVERGWIRLVHLADLVDGRVEKAQPSAGLLVGDRQYPGPLRRTRAGAAETEESACRTGDPRDVQIGQYTVQDGRVVRDVRHRPLFPAGDRALLVWRLVVKDTEPAAGGFGRVEEGLEVACRAFVPDDLAQPGTRRRTRAGIACRDRNAGNAIVRGVQLGTADAG